MAEKGKKKSSRKTGRIKSLPPKALTSKQAKDVKGGSKKHIGDVKYNDFTL